MNFTKKSGELLDYLDEARKKYGPVVDETMAKVESWGSETFQKTKEEGESILSELSDMVVHTPDDPRVQALVKRYHAHLNQFHETSMEMFSSISDLYTDDDRFATYFKRFNHALPDFLKRAVKHYTRER